ncbi:hypothetical protein [Nostoc sp. FACHB-133]|nr:hypothetical protein [Nostoc sp. FACHB-133]
MYAYNRVVLKDIEYGGYRIPVATVLKVKRS